MCSAATSAPRADRVRSLVHGAAAARTLSDAELRIRLIELEEARNTLEAEQAIVMVEMQHRAEVEDNALTPDVRSPLPSRDGR